MHGARRGELLLHSPRLPLDAARSRRGYQRACALGDLFSYLSANGRSDDGWKGEMAPLHDVRAKAALDANVADAFQAGCQAAVADECLMAVPTH